MLGPYHAGKSVSLEIECNLVVVDMLNALIHRPAIVSRVQMQQGGNNLQDPSLLLPRNVAHGGCAGQDHSTAGSGRKAPGGSGTGWLEGC